MKYATPKQRMKIYEKMVKAIDRGETFWMCHFIQNATERHDPEIIKNEFPELHKVRPNNKNSWYDLDEHGMQARKRKLLKAIELCKQ